MKKMTRRPLLYPDTPISTIIKKTKKITILKILTNYIKISPSYFIKMFLSLFINNSLFLFKNERGPKTIIEPRATFGFFGFLYEIL